MLSTKQEKCKNSRISSKILWIALATTCYSGNLVYANTFYSTEYLVTKQQTIRIKGKIVDSITKKVLNGVSIRSNGKVLAQSQADGTFETTISAGSQVSFNLIGYDSVTKTFNANSSNIEIALTEASQGIDEVVVTALGIKRDQKALGYSATTVGGEELTNAISNNWSDALTGKVAGLNVVKSGGGPLGSNNIVLRGETSLSGDNTALVVIDGIVMEAGRKMTTNGSSNYLDGDSPVDFGSSLSDLNPDDIESITVLKGPAAAALYGSRGSRGAIIITTKIADKNKGRVGVSINSNTAIGTINRWPDYQYSYGQGDEGQDLYYSYGQSEDGPSTLSTSSAWGPKFDGQMFYQYNPDYYRLTPPERTLWRPYENNRKELFTNDFTTTNSVSLSGASEKTSARFSYTNVYNTWIIPNTGYKRNSIAANLNNQITDKLSISTKINYNNRTSDNLPNTGYNNQSYMYFVRGLTPSMDAAWFENNWRPDKYGIEQTTPFSNLLDNPRTMSYDMLNTQNKNHLIGNIQANYKFNEEFNLMVRTGIDFSFDKRTQQRPFDTYKYAYGYYREQGINAKETNADFLVTYNNQRHQDFKFGLNVGGSMMNNKYNREDASTNKLSYPNVYSFSNSATAVIYNPLREEYAVHSLYGLANFSYKEFFFIDGTLRVDWSSTLASPIKNKVSPFFYPSINSSVILSQLIDLPSQISFWKFRATIAGVGGGGKNPYLNAYTYQRLAQFAGGTANPTTIPDLNLKYENTVSYELGTDFRMFKNRMKLDMTVYKNYSYNQILSTPIDPSSGYRNQIINAGEVQNTGFELEANYDIFKKKDGFSWSLFGNYTTYDTRINELPNMVDNLVLSTIYGSRGTVEARVGGRFGDMYGLGYMKNEAGDIIYKNGLPLYTEDLKYIGNANATTKFGIGSQFRYKNIGFNFLFDGQFGGVGYSLTHAVLMEEGKLNKTIPGRTNGIIGIGVVENGDGTYSPNTTITTARNYYREHFNRDNIESNTFSTDFIKLREVRIDYTIPTSVLAKAKMQRATIGLYGRDLFVFTNWPSFDPEFGSLNSSGVEKGAEIGQFPSTRNFGINLSLSF